MKKRYKKLFASLLVFLQIFSIIGNIHVTPISAEDNYEFQISEDGETPTDCDSIYDVTYRFKKERQPVDLVIVQDASGSFVNNIDNVKVALNEIIDTLDSTVDRVQFTSYKGYSKNYSVREKNPTQYFPGKY
ncbi:MAG: hypothetical protein ACK5LC_04335 [Coprobacillaceae bacterium]